MKKCPCKGCDHRTVTCHSVCSEYKEWSEWMEQIKEAKKKDAGQCKDLPPHIKKMWWKKLKQGG